MKTKLGIVAAVFVTAGFGLIHGKTQAMEYVAIALMGTGIVFLLYLLFTSRSKGETKDDQ